MVRKFSVCFFPLVMNVFLVNTISVFEGGEFWL